jgi:hypothetical protein
VLFLESLALGYFLAFAVAASAMGWKSGGRATAASLLMVAVVAAAAVLLPLAPRFWMGHVYLVAGYWIPPLVSRRDDGGTFERWLAAADVRWQHLVDRAPRWLAHTGELSYLLCYPFVPAAFACVWFLGTIADFERFWGAVLIAGFACYVSLPWLTARPPRLLPLDRRVSAGVARLNTAVLARASHGLTTFPSGHVAVSVAAALSLVPVYVPLALAFMCISAGIAFGAAIGRYHYVIDVLAGAAVGLLALLIATLAIGS